MTIDEHQPLTARGEHAGPRGRRWLGGHEALGLFVGPKRRLAVASRPQEAAEPLPEDAGADRVGLGVELRDRATDQRSRSAGVAGKIRSLSGAAMEL